MIEQRSYSQSTDPRVQEAQDRFKACQEWESVARKHAEDDWKFANGDAYNQYQWPNGIHKSRDTDERPCLTLNQVNQHNLQIINDAKQNKTAIQIKATGGDASAESATVLTAVVRHIEYESNAQVAYDTAVEHQVTTGIGYWYYELDYQNEDSFDLSIFTRRCNRPDLLFLDPDAQELDKSDSNFGFIFDDVPKKEFARRYPKWADKAGQPALGNSDWYTNDTIRVADYYRRVWKDDELFAYEDPDEAGVILTAKRSEIGDELADALGAQPGTRKRKIKRPQIEKLFIVGNEIAEEEDWPGKFIPIVPVIGREVIIDGVMDRMGHTRTMIDPQRMYNYWSSAAVENVALQSKIPWIGPSEAFEGYEEYWKTANKVNHSFLPYNGFADDGITPVAPPQRPAPPVMAQAYVDGMKVAQQELMMVSGQYQAQMGQPGNERSGKAINERQRQGDNATYHFINNLGVSLRFGGRILLDLIRATMDTRRVLKITGEDGELMDLSMDPQAKQAYVEMQDQKGKVIERTLNPTRGGYDVVAEIGPAYATRRQETFNAILQIITQAPQYTPLVGDLLLKSADFPEADEAARRLRRMIPPQALGVGPSPNEQQLMEQVQQLQGLLASALTDNAGKDLKLKGKDQLRDINAFDAETRRFAVFSKMGIDPEEMKAVVQQLIQETLQTSLGSINQNDPGDASAQGGEQPPVAGAQKAQDGQWYVPDPNRQGGWMRVGGSATPDLGGGALPPGAPGGA